MKRDAGSSELTGHGGATLRPYAAGALPLLVPLLFGVAALAVASLHDTFEEWDGVAQLLAGRELLAGKGYRGWCSHFWPPLYPLLTGLLSLAMGGFWAAKAVSLTAGVCLLLAVYRFARFLASDTRVALLAQLFVATTPLYFLGTIQAENHMLDTLFFVSALWLLVRALDVGSAASFAAAGLVAGLACLCRYTSYTLVPLALVSIAWAYGSRGAAKRGLAFIGAFVCISLPWFYENTVAHGSPFHTWHYLTGGVGIFRSQRYEWWWKTSADYSGMLELVRAHPAAFARNFVSNNVHAGALLIGEMGFVATIAGAGILYALATLARRKTLPLVGGFVLFLLVVSQAYFFDLILLSWVVVLALPSALFISRFPSLIAHYRASLAPGVGRRLVGAFLVCLVLGNIALTVTRVHTYLAGDDDDEGQLTDIKQISSTLRREDPAIGTKYVMAVHPASAWYLGSRYLQPPAYYEGTVEDWCAFRHLPPKVLHHGFTYPVDITAAEMRADYLIYNRGLAELLPQYSFLFDPDSDEIPDSFTPVYEAPDVVVYRIRSD